MSPATSKLRNLLTRTDLTKLGVLPAELRTWIAEGCMQQVGSLSGVQDSDGEEEPVFAILSPTLQQELLPKLTYLGWGSVELEPMQMRSQLLRAMLARKGIVLPLRSTGAEQSPSDGLIEELATGLLGLRQVQAVQSLAAKIAHDFDVGAAQNAAPAPLPAEQPVIAAVEVPAEPALEPVTDAVPVAEQAELEAEAEADVDEEWLDLTSLCDVAEDLVPSAGAPAPATDAPTAEPPAARTQPGPATPAAPAAPAANAPAEPVSLERLMGVSGGPDADAELPELQGPPTPEDFDWSDEVPNAIVHDLSLRPTTDPLRDEAPDIIELESDIFCSFDSSSLAQVEKMVDHAQSLADELRDVLDRVLPSDDMTLSQEELEQLASAELPPQENPADHFDSPPAIAEAPIEQADEQVDEVTAALRNEIDELRAQLQELSARPVAEPADLGPVLDAIEQDRAAAELARQRFVDAVEQLGAQLHETAEATSRLAEARRAAAAAAATVPAPVVVERSVPVTPWLAAVPIGALVLIWALVVWLKTGDGRLAVMLAVGGNAAVCTLLAMSRRA